MGGDSSEPQDSGSPEAPTSECWHWSIARKQWRWGSSVPPPCPSSGSSSGTSCAQALQWACRPAHAQQPCGIRKWLSWGMGRSTAAAPFWTVLHCWLLAWQLWRKHQSLLPNPLLSRSPWRQADSSKFSCDSGRRTLDYGPWTVDFEPEQVWAKDWWFRPGPLDLKLQQK